MKKIGYILASLVALAGMALPLSASAASVSSVLGGRSNYYDYNNYYRNYNRSYSSNSNSYSYAYSYASADAYSNYDRYNRDYYRNYDSYYRRGYLAYRDGRYWFNGYGLAPNTDYVLVLVDMDRNRNIIIDRGSSDGYGRISMSGQTNYGRGSYVVAPRGDVYDDGRFRDGYRNDYLYMNYYGYSDGNYYWY